MLGDFGQVTGLPTGKNWSHISAGFAHACGTTKEGTGHCWGWNGGPVPFPTMNQVSGMPANKVWDHINCGLYHTCGVTTTHVGYCWGFDLDMALLLSGQTSATGAVSNMPAGKQWRTILPGSISTCGLTTTGEGHCWGKDQYNSLALPAGKKWMMMSAAVGYLEPTSQTSFRSDQDPLFCGVTTSGVGHCWGRTIYGEVTNMPTGKFWNQIHAG